MKKKFLKILSLLFITGFAAYSQSEVTLNVLKIENNKDLKEFFRYTADRVPLVCAHRGGIVSGFPENSIATFESILSQIPAFFEVDPRLTKDGVIVVFHDATVNRTTDGVGDLADYTWKELQKLRLKDGGGYVTTYKIHTLEEVLQWAKGKTVLVLDKKNVPPERLLQLIESTQSESHVLISAFKFKEALYYYKKNPNLMFEAMIKTEEVFNAYDQSIIPWENIVAFSGQPLNEKLNAKLHEKGVMCMVSTMKFQEKEGSRGARSTGYNKLYNQGIDVILADNALEVYLEAKKLLPESSLKSKFFQKLTFTSEYLNVEKKKKNKQ